MTTRSRSFAVDGSVKFGTQFASPKLTSVNGAVTLLSELPIFFTFNFNDLIYSGTHFCNAELYLNQYSVPLFKLKLLGKSKLSFANCDG